MYANRYYVASVANALNPTTFVHKIRVPVYLACQWTDEQTGGHCADLAEHFTGTRLKWFTFTNGAHIDSLDPATAVRWYDFLSLFVARRQPVLSPDTRALAPLLYQTAMGISGVSFPADDPIEDQPDYASALAAFERLEPVRILFDNGAGGSPGPGAPVAAFEQSFPRFPLPGTQAVSWYLSEGGALVSGATRLPSADSFTWNPRARPATDFSGNTGPGGLWGATPSYHWTQNPAGTALSYTSAPLSGNVTVVGAGALQAWIRASTRDVDLQVTVSEVRPDGIETYVQSGWLRASERKLAPGSSLLEPALSLRRADAAPLPRGRFTQVVVPLYYEGHVYRAGSRIRITISAPGRRSAGMGVRSVDAVRAGYRVGGALGIHAVTTGAAGRARRRRADRTAAVPGAAGRAVPALHRQLSPNSRSSTSATPDSSLDAVTSSAAARTSGWAFATATA